VVAVEQIRSDFVLIFYPQKTLNDSGMVVSVQQAVAPSRPEYSGSLNLKGIIQLDLNICRTAYHRRQSNVPGNKF